MRKINIQERYKTKIMGFGEIYEIESVEKKRKEILKKYKEGKVIFQSRNQKKPTQNIIEEGPVDNPPWKSKPINQQRKIIKSNLIIKIATIIFYILVKFEKFRDEKKSHMKYYFIK